MQDLRLSLSKRILLHCVLLLSAACYLTGCCGSGTNSTTTTTTGGGGTTTPTNRPVFVTVTPDGKFAYVADAGINSIAQYSIGSNGTLTPLSPAMVTSNISKPSAIIISDDSQFAYVANQGSNTVALFKIGTTGALVPLSPATASLNGTPSRFTKVASDSDAGITNYLYVGQTRGISRFKLNSNGSLTSLGADAAVGPVADLTTDFDGDSDFSLHILNATAKTVTDAAVDFDGSLNVSTQSNPTGTQPAALVNLLQGSVVFALNQGGNSISSYSDNSGDITGLAATTPAGSAPVSGVIIDGDPDFLLVANSGSNTISVFSFFNNNALTQQSTAATGGNPAWVAGTPETGSSTSFIYVANQDGTVSQYSLNSTGTLTPLSPASVKG